jgi:hypothetical protein
MTAVKPRRKVQTDTTISLRAMQLLGKWTRVAQGHLPMGLGCACAGGMEGVPASDLEVNILDYLHQKYGRGSVVATLMHQHAGYQESTAGRLSDLLKSIAMQPLKTELAQGLLDDLATTIDSFEAMHAGRAI